MTPKNKVLVLGILLILSQSTFVYAETVEGRVADAGRTTLDLVVYDPQGQPYPNTLRLKTDTRTQLKGFDSMTKIRSQDAVKAEVKQQTSGVWYASSITRLRGLGRTPSRTPSPSLADALRSPAGKNMIRSGLTGALTGAAASSASGGKAGKGALIGAGVGILGGLLSDMLSQPSQPQQPAQAPSVGNYPPSDSR